MRNFQKIKEIEDYKQLDSPEIVGTDLSVTPDVESQMILRMLVRPKYGDWKIPQELEWLRGHILYLSFYDGRITGIKDSWCYITIRHGEVQSVTDDEWHFDGSSFRTDIIPERNYIWVNNHPTEYREGKLDIPQDFNPIEYNLFTFASKQLEKEDIKTCNPYTWYLLSPFCLHRRPPINTKVKRTFVRICFTDIEGRDINNTENPLLPTPFFGRNPVSSFRNKLKNYYS